MQSRFDSLMKLDQYGEIKGVKVKDLIGRVSFKNKDENGMPTFDGQDDDTTFGTYMDEVLAKREEKQQTAEEIKAEKANAIYDSPVHKEIESSKIWSDATTSMQQELDDKMRALAEGNDEKLQAQVNAAVAAGFKESDYLLYTLARDVVNARTNDGPGYSKNDKTQAAAMVVEVETHSHQATSQAREIKLTEG